MSGLQLIQDICSGTGLDRYDYFIVVTLQGLRLTLPMLPGRSY